MWLNLVPASCTQLVYQCFCESDNLNSLIRQPINAVSSFVFLIPVYFFRKNNFTDKNFLTAVCLLLAIGSFALHSSLTIYGQFLDVSGMYIFCIYLLLKLFHQNKYYYIKFTSTLFVLLSILFYLPMVRREIFVFLIVFVIVRVLYMRKINQSFQLAVGSIVLGGILWYLDQNRLLCSPESVFQLHALWHMCSAVSVFFMAKFVEDINKSNV